MNQKLLEKITSLVAKNPEHYQRRSGNDSKLDKFHELFPLESLSSLTLEQYCLGHGCKPENFSWWLERGLQKSIGTYSPGTAKGHVIYLQEGGGYFMHRYLKDLAPEQAITVVGKTIYAIASCTSLVEARVVDDLSALANKASIDPGRMVTGEARRLRILTMYHPEWMLPINSTSHLKHFLSLLAEEDSHELPTQSIELVIQLSTLLDVVKEATEVNVTPWGFGELLYSEELGIIPPKRENIYQDRTNKNGSKKTDINESPWWKKFFTSEEQSHAAFDLFHKACEALGVTSDEGTSAQRVSFTNTTSDGKEKLKLICGNTLVLEIESLPNDQSKLTYVSRIDEQNDSRPPLSEFKSNYSGQILGLYSVYLQDMLELDSSSRKLLLTALEDVNATYKNITKRHFEGAHRSRLLYSAFHIDGRAKLFADGPTMKPSDDKFNPLTKPAIASAQTNQILYGPPGTGKTYSTIDRALEIIDPTFVESIKGKSEERSRLKARFDELVKARRIGFVTFHQSFSYEDFVEGLKATTNENGEIRYEIEDGIFKQMCSSAAASVQGADFASAEEDYDLAGGHTWKMSLGNTQGPDAAVFDDCIEKGYILLGYGWDCDFSGVSSREEVRDRLQERYPEIGDNDYPVTACHAFVNTMKPGDLVIISDSNRSFRAIGRITGDYRYLSTNEDLDYSYNQCRNVEWLRTFAPSLPADQLINGTFSQATIYQLRPPMIELARLRSLVNGSPKKDGEPSPPFVLIVDEINRGNISRIFGELITLIEESKRAGEPEALSVKLPYSKEQFSVPSNLFLVGTMNTADRSLAQIDIALRRRFNFEELMPNVSLLSKLPLIEGIHIGQMLSAMNRRIEILYDREHTLGHTFFLSLRDDPSLDELNRIFSGSILPLLEEYFFEDWEKIRLVLADDRKPAHQAIVAPKYSPKEIEGLFGPNYDQQIQPAYKRNEEALQNPASYIGIYESKLPEPEQPSDENLP